MRAGAVGISAGGRPTLGTLIRTLLTVGVLAVVTAVSGCTTSGEAPAHQLVMGADDTPRMHVVAEIYGGALRNAGSDVSSTIRTGDDPTLLDDMDRGEVDLFGAFTGSLLAELAPQLTSVDSESVYNDLNRSLPQGVSVGDATPVSDVPQLFIATSLAQGTGVTDLSGCARLPADLPVVSVGQIDPATLASFTSAGCRLGPTEPMPTLDEAIARVASGQAVGILSGFDMAAPAAGGSQTDDAAEIQALAPTTTGEGADAVTTGPGAQDLVPVYRTAALNREQVKTINKVAGELTTADLATMTAQAHQGRSPRDLAASWLGEHGL